ncbi:MAG: GYD domain-containing protein [Planctomycetota bacterium]|nr:MAG: GYD domain-containing protein [Planctomycetota bacterium]
MIRYMAIIEYTQQGVASISESPARARAFCQQVEAAGGKVLGQYWALGEFDGCVLFEAPDQQTATQLLLGLAKAGNVRTRTVQLLDAAEFEQAVSNL